MASEEEAVSSGEYHTYLLIEKLAQAIYDNDNPQILVGRPTPTIRAPDPDYRAAIVSKVAVADRRKKSDDSIFPISEEVEYGSTRLDALTNLLMVVERDANEILEEIEIDLRRKRGKKPGKGTGKKTGGAAVGDKRKRDDDDDSDDDTHGPGKKSGPSRVGGRKPAAKNGKSVGDDATRGENGAPDDGAHDAAGEATEEPTNIGQDNEDVENATEMQGKEYGNPRNVDAEERNAIERETEPSKKKQKTTKGTASKPKAPNKLSNLKTRSQLDRQLGKRKS